MILVSHWDILLGVPSEEPIRRTEIVHFCTPQTGWRIANWTSKFVSVKNDGCSVTFRSASPISIAR
jgi:hypothetical protein